MKELDGLDKKAGKGELHQPLFTRPIPFRLVRLEGMWAHVKSTKEKGYASYAELFFSYGRHHIHLLQPLFASGGFC